MSMSAINQLNNGGLKLKSNFSAKSVAANITANKTGAANMLKGKNSFGSNSLFTPANRMGGTPRYLSGGQISRSVNAQNTKFVGSGGIPAYSGTSYAKNVSMGTSNAYNTGMGVGSMINLGLSALKQLKDMGIIGGTKEAKPQGAGEKLSQGFDTLSSNTQVQMPASANVASTITSMQGATTKEELEAAIKGAEDQVGTLSSQQAVYDTAAAEEQTQLLELDKQTGVLESAQKDASQELTDAKNKTEVMTTKRDEIKQQANFFGDEYAKATENYASAHDARIDAKANVDGMTAKAERAETSYNDAKKATADAKTGYDNALAEYESEPSTITDASGNQIPNPKKAEAEAKKNVAQAKLHEAQTAEKNAETEKKLADEQLDKAKKQYESAVSAEEKAEKQKNDAKKNVTENKEHLAKYEKDLANAQKNVDSAKGTQEAAKEKYETAKEAFESHNAKMESMTCAKNLAADNSKNVEALKAEITKQKERLTNMGKQPEAPKEEVTPQGAPKEEKVPEKKELQFKENHTVRKNETIKGVVIDNLKKQGIPITDDNIAKATEQLLEMNPVNTGRDSKGWKQIAQNHRFGGQAYLIAGADLKIPQFNIEQ